jgi:hypothetical protein
LGFFNHGNLSFSVSQKPPYEARFSRSDGYYGCGLYVYDDDDDDDNDSDDDDDDYDDDNGDDDNNDDDDHDGDDDDYLDRIHLHDKS